MKSEIQATHTISCQSPIPPLSGDVFSGFDSHKDRPSLTGLEGYIPTKNCDVRASFLYIETL